MPPPYTYLARTNAGVVAKAIDLMYANKARKARGMPEIRLRFLSSDARVDMYLSRIRDVYFLWKGQKQHIRSPEVRAFKSFKEMGKDIDPELKQAMRIVLRYGRRLEALLQEFKGVASNSASKSASNTLRSVRSASYASPANAGDATASATVVLGTVHQAKGKEWDKVTLADDFSVETDDGDTAETEEIHIAYVAMTRAQQMLCIPNTLALYFRKLLKTYSPPTGATYLFEDLDGKEKSQGKASEDCDVGNADDESKSKYPQPTPGRWKQKRSRSTVPKTESGNFKKRRLQVTQSRYFKK